MPWVHYGMMAVLSLTVVSSFEAVGAILAVVPLIMPGATARLWTDRMPSMLAVAAVHGLLSTLLGYWLSHPAVLNTSASGSQFQSQALACSSSVGSPRRARIALPHLDAPPISPDGRAGKLVKTVDEMSTRVALCCKPTRCMLIGRHHRPRRRPRMARCRQRRSCAYRCRARCCHAISPATNFGSLSLTARVGLAPDHVHDAAEWIEHHLDHEEIKGLEQVVGGGRGAQ